MDRTELRRKLFRKDDPMRYLFVPKTERKDEDPPIENEGEPGGPITKEDLDWYRQHPDG